MEQNRGHRRQSVVTGSSLFCFVFLMTTALGAQGQTASQLQGGLSKDSANVQEPVESTVIEGELSIDNILDASQEAPAKNDAPISNEEEQFVRINKSLKNLIDENQKLMQQKDKLEKDIESLRGERMVQETRLRTLARERLSTLKKSEIIDSVTANYEQEIQELKKKLEEATQNKPGETTSALAQVTTLQGESQEAPMTPQAVEPQAQPQQVPIASIAVMRGTAEMAAEMGKLVEENQILRKDTIKLHYNLANLFFEQGRYELASSEYKRVLDLMPQDAATHYNLAFVSAEYLKDYPTAIEHYKRYLALAPIADDIGFVKNQILQLQLRVQNKIDSYVDKEDGQTDLPLK